jgi:hypothetical protein
MIETKDLYNVNRFQVIKEFGYPKIEPLAIQKKENNPKIHWNLLDKNNNCVGILILDLCEIDLRGKTEIDGIIEKIVNENNSNLKYRFINHFFLNIIDDELNDYLEEWNDFKHYWSIICFDKNISFDLAKRLNCEIQ